MWPNTALTARLGITYPIVQAPMASISTAPLAAAVSMAGGLGSIGSAVMPPAAVEAQVRDVRARTDRPFALNFFVHVPAPPAEAAAASMWQRLEPYRRALGLDQMPPIVVPPPFGPAMLECVVALRPAAVSFHFGLPDEATMRALHDVDVAVLSSATTVAEARELEARGADAIIAQGIEAGGHRGTFQSELGDGEIGTLALVPQVVDAVKVPVLAAGGIFDGRGIAAALVLGASGAQLGTAFLGCAETVIDPVYRRTLGEARAARTRITRLLSGRPARAIVTRFIEAMADQEAEALPFPQQRVLTAALAAAGMAQGDVELLAMWAGQGAPKLRPMPAADLVATLAKEVDAALERARDRGP